MNTVQNEMNCQKIFLMTKTTINNQRKRWCTEFSKSGRYHS